MSRSSSTICRQPAFAPRALARRLHAVYSFPMGHDGQSLGALNLYRTSPTTLAPAQIAAGQTLADVATIYILHARNRDTARLAEQQLLRLAITDPLTGLANRRLFIDHLTMALAHSKRNGRSVSVLYLDLDHLKAVNDRLGHAAGDQVLIEVADRLRHALRPSDTAARLAGDEFAIVCDEIGDPDAASSLAARILHVLRAPISIGEELVTVTPSIGVATTTSTHADAETLLADADAALYLAKGNGRNRVEHHIH